MALCMIPGLKTPYATGVGLLALCGVVVGVAQIIFTQAFRLAAPSLLAPFEYLAMIWAAGFGYQLHTVSVTGWTVVAAAVVLTLGAWVLGYAAVGGAS